MYTNMFIGTLSESHNKVKALLDVIKMPLYKEKVLKKVINIW